MASGCEGVAATEIETVRGVLAPQALTADTEIFPLPDPVITVILFVADEPVHPEGKLQLYEVAPLTALTEYVCEVPWQTEVFPETFPG